MNSKIIALFVGLFALIVVGMFTFAYIKRSEIEQKDVDTSPVAEESSAYNQIERIDAKHFFIDGVHTIAGEILMPTPCDLLDNTVRVMESYPEQVAIDFTVINNSDICAQVVTPQRFLVSFSASENASISATLEGQGLPLNLIPAAEGESPDDFELYIKG